MFLVAASHVEQLLLVFLLLFIQVFDIVLKARNLVAELTHFFSAFVERFFCRSQLFASLRKHLDELAHAVVLLAVEEHFSCESLLAMGARLLELGTGVDKMLLKLFESHLALLAVRLAFL